MALPDLAPETRCYIDGKLVEDMERALAAARRAFDETGWSNDHALRARCVRQLYEGLLEDKEQLRSIVVREAGAPLSLTSYMHVDDPIEMMAYWADKPESYEWERELSDTNFLGNDMNRIMRKEPIGVVGAITPWNVPLLLNITKIGPSLASGCTLVLKPAPDTPWSATHIGKIAAEKTDLPPGVLNIVSSSDHLTGEVLTRDPRVDMVTFTGSTATGRHVMECGAATLKKVFLELGGKSAAIILDDADFAAVLPMGAMSCVHGGQGCAITTRWLLPRSRYAEGVEILKAAFENWSYGDPEDPANLQGPQISQRQQERVLSYIEKGKAEGARCLVGGGKPDRKGFFIEPTLFVDVDPKATIAQEEIFGPVVVVIPYDDDDDAVRIANDSIYGLSGSIQSASNERALAVGRRIRTGTMSLNGGQWFNVDSPFGGYKQSGIGRENGAEGFEGHLETKMMALPR
ncbi:MAG: aldehyde dehydrogenase family protein [Deltaproteobacteria bacterium]|nr:aldehyde dehydrogenase family protein [Deltaproteobacteria bacterium]